MLKILLDTSFIIDSIRYKIDIKDNLKDILLEPFELFIIEKTLKELEKKRLNKLILEMIKDLNIIKSPLTHVDEAILSLEGYLVATQDKELKRRLKAKGIKTISIISKGKYILK